ncbi:Armadillo-type fold [Pelomyxa schiedti]|nr:Armadillo-type fold [Pelomyxa schiedti]
MMHHGQTGQQQQTAATTQSTTAATNAKISAEQQPPAQQPTQTQAQVQQQQQQSGVAIKPLSFKVRGVSKEVPGSKASALCEPDIRTFWSSNSTAKEMVLLELEETCIVSQIKVHNKSVNDWEWLAALSLKNDSYVKFASIQVFGIEVPGMVPEFQPVIDTLSALVCSSREQGEQHLTLLREISKKLSPFSFYLQQEIQEAKAGDMHFLGSLAGVYYPILSVCSFRDEQSEGCKAAPFILSVLRETRTSVHLHHISQRISGLLPTIQSSKSPQMSDDPQQQQIEALLNLLFCCYSNPHFSATFAELSDDMFKKILPLIKGLRTNLSVPLKNIEASPFRITLSQENETALSTLLIFMTNITCINLLDKFTPYLDSSSVQMQSAASLALFLSVGPLSTNLQEIQNKSEIIIELLKEFLPLPADKYAVDVLLFLKLILAGCFDSHLDKFLASKIQVLFLFPFLRIPLALPLLLPSLEDGLRSTAEIHINRTMYILNCAVSHSALLPQIEQELLEKHVDYSSAFASIAPSCQLPLGAGLVELEVTTGKTAGRGWMDMLPAAHVSLNSLEQRALAILKDPDLVHPSTPLDSMSSEDVDVYVLHNSSVRHVKAAQLERIAQRLHTAGNKESIDMAIQTILSAAECHINPYFLANFPSSLKELTSKDSSLTELKSLEESRDVSVMSLLLLGAVWDDGSIRKEDVLSLLNGDADMGTIIRQNQELLGNFFMKRLMLPSAPLTESLISSFISFLHWATPKKSYYNQVIKTIVECSKKFDTLIGLTNVNIPSCTRLFRLITDLVHTASICDTIEPIEWINAIDSIATSPHIMVHYFGWCAVSGAWTQFPHTVMSVALPSLSAVLRVYSDSLYQPQFDAVRSTEALAPELKPELLKIVPNLLTNFSGFANEIMKATCRLIEEADACEVPSLLTWVGGLYEQFVTSNETYQTKNFSFVARALLEQIIKSHTVHVAHEIPNLLSVVTSLCICPWITVDVVSRLLDIVKPIFNQHNKSVGSAFEMSSFSELLSAFEKHPHCDHLLLLVATVFADLSEEKKQIIVHILNLVEPFWSTYSQLADSMIQAAVECVTSFGLPEFWTSVQVVLSWCQELQAIKKWHCSGALLCFTIKATVNIMQSNAPKNGIPSEIIELYAKCLSSRSMQAPRLKWRQKSIIYMQDLLRPETQISPPSLTHFVSVIQTALEHPEPELREAGLQLILHSIETLSPNLGPIRSVWSWVFNVALLDNFPKIRMIALTVIERFLPFILTEEISVFSLTFFKLCSELLVQGRPNSMCHSRIGLELLAMFICHHSEIVTQIPISLWESVKCVQERVPSCAALAGKILLTKLDPKCGSIVTTDIKAPVSRPSEILDPETAELRDTILRVVVKYQAEDKLEAGKKIDVKRLTLYAQEAAVELSIRRTPQSETVSNDSTCEVSNKHVPEKTEFPSRETLLLRIQSLEKEIEEENNRELIKRVQKRIELDTILTHEREIEYHRQQLRKHEALLRLRQEQETTALKDIERQIAIEEEREKTKQLKHKVDMDSEHQTQLRLERKATAPREREQYSARAREREREKETVHIRQEPAITITTTLTPTVDMGQLQMQPSGCISPPISTSTPPPVPSALPALPPTPLQTQAQPVVLTTGSIPEDADEDTDLVQPVQSFQPYGQIPGQKVTVTKTSRRRAPDPRSRPKNL